MKPRSQGYYIGLVSASKKMHKITHVRTLLTLKGSLCTGREGTSMLSYLSPHFLPVAKITKLVCGTHDARNNRGTLEHGDVSKKPGCF